MELCHECKERTGTIFITCSAHKERHKLCESCWSKREEQDRCSEPGCHGRVHAVQRSRVLRSYDYFARKGKECGMIVLFMCTVFGMVFLMMGPFIWMVEKADEEEAPPSLFHDVSVLSVLFTMSHMVLYAACCMLFIMGWMVEWMEGRARVFRDFGVAHRVPLLIVNLYCIQFVLCGALYAAPTYAQWWIYLSDVYLLLTDAFHVVVFRQELSKTWREVKGDIYNWFMEEREEHVFLAETEAFSTEG